MFIGIKISKDNCDKIIKIQQDLKELDVKGNYTMSDNLHLTLVFLGELNVEEIEIVRSIIRNINCPSFTMEIKRISMFNDIVVLNVETSAILKDLYYGLVKRLNENGILIPLRYYKPHITIVRGSSKEIYKDLNISEEVKEVILFSSEFINNRLAYIPKERKTL